MRLLACDRPVAGLDNHNDLMQDVFTKYLETPRLIGTATARQGAAIELTWTVGLRPGNTPASLVTELNRLEGVQNVELRRLGT